MNPLRIHVVPLGRGYVAESRVPLITALGSTAEEAVENARVMALEVLDAFACSETPSSLIVRIDDAGRSAIVMQSTNKPFSLEQAGKEIGSSYFDSDGNTFAAGR